jgi:predicted metal-dependent hydrolase
MNHTSTTPAAMHHPSMTVRHLDVDISGGFDIYWNGGDAYRSQLLNALSFMFPVGEQFFIDSVRHYAKAVAAQGNTVLSGEIKQFAAQEATHRHLHQQYNDYLVSQGYEPWVENMLKRLMRLTEGFNPLTKLAVTAAYEHYTAILGDGLFRHASWSADMDPTMRQIWLWHAAEESEHKAVALDTYRAAGGGYLRRITLFAFVSIEFLIYANVQSSKMLIKDGQFFKRKTWGSALRWWLGREGILWHTIPHWLAYFKPGFHPWQHDNQALLARWREAYATSYRSLTPQPERHTA